MGEKPRNKAGLSHTERWQELAAVAPDKGVKEQASSAESLALARACSRVRAALGGEGD